MYSGAICGVGVDSATRTCWSFCACAGRAAVNKRNQNCKNRHYLFHRETPPLVTDQLLSYDKFTEPTLRSSNRVGYAALTAARRHRPTAQHQVGEKQHKPCARQRPPGLLPCGAFPWRRRVKTLETVVKFFRIDHLAAGFLGEPAEQRQIGFQLAVLFGIGRDVRHGRHRQRRFAGVALGVKRDEMNAALRSA